MISKELSDKLSTLPARPGVYFHKDATGEVIYVGKAAVLKNRVRQYFNNSPKDTKTMKLVENIAMTDWIETDSEIDALFLENEMIKRYKPKFNILLRDDKNNSFVRIDFKSEWPTVTLTRSPLDDGAEYIGPFYGSAPVKKALRYLRRSFPYLTKESELDSRLLQQLGLVPRKGGINKSSSDYHRNLRHLAQYLKGGRVALQRELENEMKQAAKELDFERAAELRNQINSLNELRKQIIFGSEEFMDISKDQALAGAQKLFNLPDIPRRIEGYDISHLGGQDVVGSLVVATNGVADKREYRKFKISKDKNDDFAAMREAMMRRFSKRHVVTKDDPTGSPQANHLPLRKGGIKDGGIKDKWPLPDLIVVDGGEPQINAVHDVVLDLPIIGLSKENDEIIVSREYSHVDTTVIEQIYSLTNDPTGSPQANHLPLRKGGINESSPAHALSLRKGGVDESLPLDGEGGRALARSDEAKRLSGIKIASHGSYYSINLHAGAKHSAGHSFTFIGSAPTNEYTDLLKLLQRLRDESHRFAITYQRNLKRKNMLK